MPFEIITAEEAAAELGVSVDSGLTRRVAAVHAHLFEGCGRTFERVERTIYPSGWGPNVDYVFLTEAPIFDVLEVRIDSCGLLGPETVVANTPSAIAENFAWKTGNRDFALHYLNGYFPEGEHRVMVRFVGGLWSFTDEDPEHQTGKPPADL